MFIFSCIGIDNNTLDNLGISIHEWTSIWRTYVIILGELEELNLTSQKIFPLKRGSIIPLYFDIEKFSDELFEIHLKNAETYNGDGIIL